MKTRRLITALCVLTFSLASSWAQGPNGSEDYYQAANGKSGEALKTAMYNIIKITTAGWSYDGLKTAYKTTDTRSDGYLRDWYSNATYYTPGSACAGSYNVEGDGYNREHLVPQSWFSEASPMKSDVWHVVPSDAKINNERGSYPLGEVGSSYTGSKNNYSKWGMARSGLGYSGTVFEPNDEVKGDIARAYFYMATCYENKISSWANNATASYVFDGNTYPGLTDWCLEMMMRWSALDPVDEIEIARNNVIAAKQNRNPFIDYPGLEDYIWGDKKTVAFSYDNYDGSSTGKQYVTMAFSASTATATLGETFTAPTLSMSPSGLTVTYSSSNTSVATVNSSTGAVTLVAAGTTTITASFAGNDNYYANSASYTLTVKQQGGDDPTPSGETLLWESFSGYTGTSDGSEAITTSNENLDYASWSSFTKVFLGENGCGKLGSSSAVGSMEAKNIALTGSGVLTLKVKKYKSDSGVLNVTISGATAEGDMQITPQSAWTEYTINLTDAAGSVSIKFATSTKRAYIDDIKLVSVNQQEETLLGDVNKDGSVTIADVKALVNILLGKDVDETLYDHEAADVNEDGKKTIADVTALVNILLGRIF